MTRKQIETMRQHIADVCAAHDIWVRYDDNVREPYAIRKAYGELAAAMFRRQRRARAAPAALLMFQRAMAEPAVTPAPRPPRIQLMVLVMVHQSRSVRAELVVVLLLTTRLAPPGEAPSRLR